MEKIKKDYSQSQRTQMDLSSYLKSEVNPRHNQDVEKGSYTPLAHIFAVAAFMAVPMTMNGQCISNTLGVDVDGDGNADLSIYQTWRTNGYTNAIRSVVHYQAIGVNPANNLTFFGTQFSPRSCYYNTCVFPTPNGATTGARMGSVAILRERITSCNTTFSTVKLTNTYTISGNTYTSCYTTFYTNTYCQPTITNGNFQIGVPGTLAFKLNNEFHFIELTLGTGNPVINKIDGVLAEPCDGGCQDVLKLTFNEVFPIDSYHAADRIETNDIVDLSRMVELKAGTEIEMLEGFEVILGGELLADIDTCD